jgi:hypothetical protein
MEVGCQCYLLYLQPKKYLGVNNDRQIDASIVEKLPPIPCQQGVYHIVALPFALKSIWRPKKKHYGNSNISPCKNIPIFKKILQKKPESFKILELDYN